MSQPPQFRIVSFNASPQLRIAGCLGCLFVIFVMGGIAGLLLSGWKALLGM
ncbi:MAG TPA: hypothetical protein VKB71_09755 [Rhizomicrobium sp.]|nr:hypothetical protein [Rhizomicrobium sp.]